MYERNAIVLERYFNQMFGYNMKNNIKNNFKNYSELLERLEKYKNISEEEDIIMQEYDAIANKIRAVQKTQENLNKKNNKLQQERAEIFHNIDESAEEIQKKINNINNNIQRVNSDIEENVQTFIELISEFNDKSVVRINSGRTRRGIEHEYNKKLKETVDNYEKIDTEIEKSAKRFIEIDTNNIEKELEEKINKNGEREKIPFNKDVIIKAIAIIIDVQKRETNILTNIYDKTNKLFNEIKNNTVKIEKHKKIVKDSKSKLDFVSAIEEYIVQFLDNERLTVVNGEEEHSKLMREACRNLDEDLLQINNLYTLLLKEISKKVTKKSYSELYNYEYLNELERKSNEFDKQVKKLNLPVTVINPNYWRIEGMKRIYEVFSNCVTEVYGRDLTEYIPIQTVEEDTFEVDYDDFDEESFEDSYEYEDFEEEGFGKENKNNSKRVKNKKKQNTKENDEFDKKVDMILGFDDSNNEDEDDWDDDIDNNEYDDIKYGLSSDDWDDEEDWEEDEDFEEDDWTEEDEEYDDEDDFDDDDENEKDEEYDDDFDTEDDDWEDEEEWEDEELDDEDEIFDEEDEDFEEDAEEEQSQYDESWENEFVNIKKKDKKKTKFFDKFKK